MKVTYAANLYLKDNSAKNWGTGSNGVSGLSVPMVVRSYSGFIYAGPPRIDWSKDRVTDRIRESMEYIEMLESSKERLKDIIGE